MRVKAGTGCFLFALMLAWTAEGKPPTQTEAKVSSLPAGAIARLRPTPFLRRIRGSICVFFLPDGRTLATTVPDRKLVFWDWRVGKIKKSLDGHYQVAFSADGKLMASRGGPKEKIIRILEVDSGKQVGQAEGIGMYSGGDFAFSPDGQFLAVGGGSPNRQPQDPPLWLWDVATSRKVAQFTLREMLGSLAFSPSGKYLATSHRHSNKGVQLQIWNVATRKLGQGFASPSVYAASGFRGFRCGIGLTRHPE